MVYSESNYLSDLDWESAVSGQADRKWGRTVGERLYLYSDGATGFYGVAGGSAIVCMGGLGLYL